jgi:hypothetical protein
MPSEDQEPRSWLYVVTQMGNGFGQDKSIAVTGVNGPLDNLTAELRPWLLDFLRDGDRDNGWYCCSLVAVDEDGGYDTYCALAAVDILWYWDQECVPVSS